MPGCGGGMAKSVLPRESFKRRQFCFLDYSEAGKMYLVGAMGMSCREGVSGVRPVSGVLGTLENGSSF